MASVKLKIVKTGKTIYASMLQDWGQNIKIGRPINKKLTFVREKTYSTADDNMRNEIIRLKWRVKK